MNGFLKNITTGRDNQTHDVVRVAIVIVTFMFPFLIIWGVAMASISFAINRPFDLQTYYNAFSVIILAFSGFLAGGAGALYWKKTTEPDGSSQTVEKMTEGQPKETIKMTQVNNLAPDSVINP